MTIAHASYVAATFDSNGRINAVIGDDGSGNTEYSFSVSLEIAFNHSADKLQGVVKSYLTAIDVQYSYQEFDSRERGKFLIHSQNNIEAFLRSIDDYIVAKREEVDILLEDIYPLMESGKHLHKPGFLQVMERVERLRNVGSGYSGIYTKEYFEDQWLRDDGSWDVEYSRKPTLKGRRTPKVEKLNTKTGISTVIEQSTN